MAGPGETVQLCCHASSQIYNPPTPPPPRPRPLPPPPPRPPPPPLSSSYPYGWGASLRGHAPEPEQRPARVCLRLGRSAGFTPPLPSLPPPPPPPPPPARPCIMHQRVGRDEGHRGARRWLPHRHLLPGMQIPPGGQSDTSIMH